MNRKKRIQNLISKNFINWKFEVTDNSLQHRGHNNFDGKQESHFFLILNKPTDSKEKRIEIHRRLNDLLQKEYDNGLHSFEIKIIN